MSTVHYGSLILGIKLSDIKDLSVEKITEPYEVFDKHGNPTGKMDVDIFYKLKFKDRERKVTKVCVSNIEEILQLTGGFKVYDLDNYSYLSLELDSTVLGIKLSDQYNFLHDKKFDEIELSPEDLTLVRTDIKNKLGIDILPKLYLSIKTC